MTQAERNGMTCTLWPVHVSHIISLPSNEPETACLRNTLRVSVFNIRLDRETGSISVLRIYLSRCRCIPTIAAVVDRIYFINMSFEHFLSDQLALWRVSHVVRYFFNGFVLFAFLVLLKKIGKKDVYSSFESWKISLKSLFRNTQREDAIGILVLIFTGFYV